MFEYGGYHFEPVGKFFKTDSSYSLSRMIRSHSTWYKKFYKASNNSTADVFLCVETGKVYIPCENVLFEFLGEYEPLNP